jgi:acylglycerol lipase
VIVTALSAFALVGTSGAAPSAPLRDRNSGTVRPAAHASGAGTTLSLQASDGHRIPCTYWPTAVGGGCTLVCVHAFGDHRQAYAEHARLFGDHGHMLVSFDQRGFGQTPNRGAFADVDAYVRDLATVVANARHLAPEQPVVLLGESFGASVALAVLARRPTRLGRIDGLVLAGPGVREDLPAKPVWDALIDGAAAIFGSRSVRLNQADERLTHTAQRRLESDPLVVRDIRADTYERVVELADAASLDASQVKCPTLVLYGSEDNLIARASIDALMRRLGRQGALKIYERRPHLVFQARERADIDKDVLHFLSTIG